MSSKVRIFANGPHRTTIMVDGRPVNGVRSFYIEQSVEDALPTLHLEIPAEELEIEGYAETES